MSDDVYDVYDDARKELSSNTTYPIPYREEYAETRSVFHLHHRSKSVKRGVKVHVYIVFFFLSLSVSLSFFLSFFRVRVFVIAKSSKFRFTPKEFWRH